MEYNWCIPMPRERLRSILVRELYGKQLVELYDKLQKQGVDTSPMDINEYGMRLYLQDYYPGKYKPIQDR
jgi:hypothetical protein